MVPFHQGFGRWGEGRNSDREHGAFSKEPWEEGTVIPHGLHPGFGEESAQQKKGLRNKEATSYL